MAGPALWGPPLEPAAGRTAGVGTASGQRPRPRPRSKPHPRPVHQCCHQHCTMHRVESLQGPTHHWASWSRPGLAHQAQALALALALANAHPGPGGAEAPRGHRFACHRGPRHLLRHQCCGHQLRRPASGALPPGRRHRHASHRPGSHQHSFSLKTGTGRGPHREPPPAPGSRTQGSHLDSTAEQRCRACMRPPHHPLGPAPGWRAGVGRWPFPRKRVRHGGPSCRGCHPPH